MTTELTEIRIRHDRPNDDMSWKDDPSLHRSAKEKQGCCGMSSFEEWRHIISHILMFIAATGFACRETAVIGSIGADKESDPGWIPKWEVPFSGTIISSGAIVFYSVLQWINMTVHLQARRNVIHQKNSMLFEQINQRLRVAQSNEHDPIWTMFIKLQLDNRYILVPTEEQVPFNWFWNIISFIGIAGLVLGCFMMVNATYLKTGIGLFVGGNVFIKVAFDRVEDELEQYTKQVERTHEEIQLCCVHLGCSGLQQQLHSLILPRFQMQSPPPDVFCSAVNRYMSVHYRPIQIGMTVSSSSSTSSSSTSTVESSTANVEEEEEQESQDELPQPQQTQQLGVEETTISSESTVSSSASSSSSSAAATESATMSPFKQLSIKRQAFLRSQSTRTILPRS